MEFYETLQKVMKERGISAAELSRKTGVSQSLFSEMKSGRSKSPTYENARKIIHALGMTLDEFEERQMEDEC